MHDKNNAANNICSFQATYNNLENKEEFTAWSCEEKTENKNAFLFFMIRQLLHRMRILLHVCG